VPDWHECGGFLKMLRSVEVMEAGHRDVAAYPTIRRGAQQTLIGGGLGLSRELLRLAGCGEFDLLGLVHQLIGLVEAAGLDRGVGPGDEIPCDQVLRIQRRQPLHRRFVLLGDLGQLLR